MQNFDGKITNNFCFQKINSILAENFVTKKLAI